MKKALLILFILFSLCLEQNALASQDTCGRPHGGILLREHWAAQASVQKVSLEELMAGLDEGDITLADLLSPIISDELDGRRIQNSDWQLIGLHTPGDYIFGLPAVAIPPEVDARSRLHFRYFSGQGFVMLTEGQSADYPYIQPHFSPREAGGLAGARIAPYVACRTFALEDETSLLACFDYYQASNAKDFTYFLYLQVNETNTNLLAHAICMQLTGPDALKRAECKGSLPTSKLAEGMTAQGLDRQDHLLDECLIDIYGLDTKALRAEVITQDKVAWPRLATHQAFRQSACGEAFSTLAGPLAMQAE